MISVEIYCEVSVAEAGNNHEPQKHEVLMCFLSNNLKALKNLQVHSIQTLKISKYAISASGTIRGLEIDKANRSNCGC